jgi:regulatory protein
MLITITKILAQKNKKNRFSLYSGDEFITGVSEEILVSFGIYAGCQIDSNTLQKIKKKEYLISLRDQALRFLARRPHSIKELTDKLIHKRFNIKNIKPIIDDFIQKGYLNDREFTVTLIKEEIKLKKNGPLLIKNKLISKGIEPLQAEEMIRQTYAEELQYKNCHSLAAKKIKLLTKYPELEQKNKLALFLKRKGFYWETVQKVMEEFINTEY